MPYPPAIGALAVCLAAAGCAATPQQAASQDNLLVASGFTAMPANTPQRADALRALPRNRLVLAKSGAVGRYVYADPLVCGCLYMGDQAAYGRYTQALQGRRFELQKEAEAQEGPYGLTAFLPE